MNLDELISSGRDRFKKKFPHTKRKVLLVGGGGYIGLVVASKLIKNEIDVLVLDNFIYQHETLIKEYKKLSNLKFIFNDIRNPLNIGNFDGEITDIVILAGLVGDPITKKYPDLSSEINGISIRRLIDQLPSIKLDKVIFISTCSNYGLIGEDELANEEFELNPLSSYAKEKVRNEKYLLGLEGEVNFSPTILRFATAFGKAPRMRFDLTVNEFVMSMHKGVSLEVYDPDTWRPYCHVQDFANLVLRTLSIDSKVTHGEIFNAGGDENNHTKRSIVQIISQYLPKAEINYTSGGKDLRNYKVDFSKVKNKLFFQPTWSVERGVKEIIDCLDQGEFSNFNANKNFYGNYKISKRFF